MPNSEIESQNESLLYTLSKLRQFVNRSAEFVVAVAIVGIYVGSEVLFLVTLMKKRNSLEDGYL